MTIKIGIVAGEASGDLLGAGLMAALKEYLGGPETSPTQVRFIGVGGPAMLAAGLEPLAALEDLSVNGFKDPILRLPALLKLFRSLRDTCLEEAVDVFVGVDFNVFNLLLEKSLKKRGVKTVHYVSPSVYAWRTGRTRKIARSADLLLCLFPFEPDFYTNTAVKAVFVGHPLADQVDPPTTADADKMKQ